MLLSVKMGPIREHLLEKPSSISSPLLSIYLYHIKLIKSSHNPSEIGTIIIIAILQMKKQRG